MAYDIAKEKNGFSFVLLLFLFGVGGGIILQILLSLYILPPEGVSFFATIVFFSSVFIIIGISGLLLGIFCGFIFAVPKENNNPKDTNNKNYLNNDNLVQISDWLTKIIVGVGLTQLYSIPSLLKRIASYLESFFQLGPMSLLYANVQVASLIYFLLLGFLLAYYWTRLKYKVLLTVTDEDINDILDEKDKELEAKEREINKNLATLNNIKEALDDGGIISKSKIKSEEFDPQKGKWGSCTKQNDRLVVAKVYPTSWDDDLFHIELSVKSTNKDNPLQGFVKFHLHPTFSNSEPQIEVVNGVARLKLIAWGAFTLGIETDNGTTQLELDLAEDVPEAPKIFKER